MSQSNADHPSLKPFKQHGFVAMGAAGERNVYGRCPFCESKDHFFVNVETKMWDCKKCGKSGGFQTLLKEIAAKAKSEFKGKIAIALSRDRGIALSILKAAGVGYNSITKEYCIPLMDVNSEKVWDIRIYHSKRLISTAGCSVGLFGWEGINKNFDTIWLCEGEWDGMVISELIQGGKKEIALAVPGANTFKAEWMLYFKGKRVNVLYDNDKAGREGSIKVYNKLKTIASDLRFIHWPADFEEGYDVRDLYNDSPNEAISFIKDHLKPTPPGVSEDGGNESSAAKANSGKEYDGEGCSAEDVYAVYRKWLYLPNTTVLDVMYGTIIANRLQGDPLWMFIVAPSGGTKSELLMSLSGAANMMSTTSITPHGLISGANFGGGGDPSLIPKLDGKILVIKDFTTILEMNTIARDEIFGILRDAYDGKIEKYFGNGIFRSYSSKFGILAGVTPAIEFYTDGHTALGERFLRYYAVMPESVKDKRELLRRAVMNTASEDGMREELNAIADVVLNYDFSIIPTIPERIADRILSLAQWTAIMRASVMRDKYSKEVTHKPFAELGTRLAKQFCKLMIGIGMFKRLKEVGIAEYRVVRDIAIGTVPSRMESVVRLMVKRGKKSEYSTQEISDMLGLPLVTSARVIEDLFMLGIVKKDRISSVKVNYRLSPDALNIMELAEIY